MSERHELIMGMYSCTQDNEHRATPRGVQALSKHLKQVQVILQKCLLYATELHYPWKICMPG